MRRRPEQTASTTHEQRKQNKTRPRITPKVLVQRGIAGIGEHKLLSLRRYPEADLRVQKPPTIEPIEPIARLRCMTVLVQKRMKAPQDGTPSNPMPCMPLPDDRFADDDTAGQPTDGLFIRLAVTIPEKVEIPQQRLPAAFRHRYLESPRVAVFPGISRIRVHTCTDLQDEFGEHTLDLVLEAYKGLFGGSQSGVTALVERVCDEIMKDGARLLGDAPRLGEDVVEHVVNVHAMVVQRVFVRISEGDNNARTRNEDGGEKTYASESQKRQKN